MKKILLVTTIFFVILIIGYSSFASTETATCVYIGKDQVDSGTGLIDYSITAFVYYDSNTSSSMSVDTLVEVVINSGTLGVTAASFKVHDQLFQKVVTDYFDIMAINSGSSRRIESDWWEACVRAGYIGTGNKNFTKNDFVFTYIGAGMGWASYTGGFGTYWYPTYKYVSFLS